MTRPIEEFAERQDLDLPAISAAEASTVEALEELRPLMEPAATRDVSVVVFGSLGRREVTRKSDVDWTLLLDGPADPVHFDSALELEGRIAESRFAEPGREGTFGGLAYSHELVHEIGGQDDTNRNTTRRILLLLESLPIGRHEAYDRVVRNVLARYITEDWGWAHSRGPADVPRFLQNDLARYWRTVAVDFAYKRRDRGGKGWALRTVKLRLSRKMTYAAGLLACFSCELEGVLKGSETGETPLQRVVDHLVDRLSHPPLDIIALAGLSHERIARSTARLFRAYDAFLQLLNDDEKRGHLEALPPRKSADDPVYEEARGISHDFQAALDGIFFDDDPEIAELTRIYGVF